MDPSAFLYVLSRLRSGCVVNYSHQLWLTHRLGVNWPYVTVVQINARNERLRRLCRGIADGMVKGDGKVDCEELIEATFR